MSTFWYFCHEFLLSDCIVFCADRFLRPGTNSTGAHCGTYAGWIGISCHRRGTIWVHDVFGRQCCKMRLLRIQIKISSELKVLNHLLFISVDPNRFRIQTLSRRRLRKAVSRHKSTSFCRKSKRKCIALSFCIFPRSSLYFPVISWWAQLSIIFMNPDCFFSTLCEAVSGCTGRKFVRAHSQQCHRRSTAIQYGWRWIFGQYVWICIRSKWNCMK